MRTTATPLALALSGFVVTGSLTGCVQDGFPVAIDYASDTYEKQVEMCVDLVIEAVDWVDRDGVRATVPVNENAQSREFIGTLEAEDDPAEYSWTCDVTLLDGSKLQATLTRLEPLDAPRSGG